MFYFLLGILTGWVLFKRPEWANKALATISEKARTGIFKF
jgi:hypothetical protein